MTEGVFIGASDQDTKDIWLMIDSGAGSSVFKRETFRAPRRACRGPGLASITGESIKRYGEQTPAVELPSGRTALIEGVEADTKRNVLAVSKACDRQFWTVFGPTGSFVTKVPISKPRESEDLQRFGNHF